MHANHVNKLYTHQHTYKHHYNSRQQTSEELKQCCSFCRVHKICCSSVKHMTRKSNPAIVNRLALSVSTCICCRQMTFMSCSSARELIMVALRLRDPPHLTAIFAATVRQPESGWPGQVGLDWLVDQDPTFGFCLLVASLVPRSVVVG